MADQEPGPAGQTQLEAVQEQRVRRPGPQAEPGRHRGKGSLDSPWQKYRLSSLQQRLQLPESLDLVDANLMHPSLPQSMLKLVAGEERRWKAADEDEDGSLNIVEFQSFLHPETDRRMEEVVLSELMEDMDLDHDQRISLEEYITDMVSEKDEESIRESERVNFRNNIDLDNNGYLDRAEVQYEYIYTIMRYQGVRISRQW